MANVNLQEFKSSRTVTQTMNHRFLEVSAALTAFLGGAFLLVFWTVHYGPAWPNRDSFGYFYYLDLAQSGRLGLKDFIFARNNEHLVAFHYAFAITLLKLFDLNTKVIVFANATLLLASGLMTYLAVRGSARTRVACVALPVLIVISLLNPSQTSYLLWDFQLWFYIDIALLTANTLLAERFGFRAYPVVALFCLLATGSEAQGSFLWLAAGIQFFYVGLSAKSRASTKAGVLILAIHLCAFLAAAWLLLQGKYGVPLPREDAGLLGGLVGHLRYGITIIGGGYGIRNPNVALVLGALSLAAWCIGTVLAFRERFATALFRVGVVMSGISLLWTAAFAVGRESLGIPWAFDGFHSSPMLIPFYTGIGLYAAAFLQYSKSSLVRIGSFLALICVAPSFAAVPFGRERSVELQQHSLLAASVECGEGNVPLYLRLRLSGLEGEQELYREIVRYRTQLCAHQDHVDTASDLLKLPVRYVELASHNPRAEDALRTLWYVYLARIDLRRAFPLSNPYCAENLLKWAAADVKSGDTSEKDTLLPYAGVYEQLGLQ
jgi:hypothetical protein